MADCGNAVCRDVVERGLEKLREEFDAKHRENREELQRLRDTHNELRNDFHEFKGRVDPYLDNGQPGIFSKMVEKLDRLFDMIVELQVQDSADKGRREEHAWLQPTIVSLVVGLVLVLAQHFWK